MEFKLLIDAYRQHLEAFHKEIETICSSGQRKKIPASPNYQTEVIIPVYRSLAAEMPGYKIKIPDSKTYLPIKGYYRIRIGITTVGGFSTPEGNDFSLYFTPMRHAKPTGKRNKINTTEELVQLIKNQLETE
ncbi:hypothetical protein [Parabacteroides distasonis]|jgi:hypothetical protein|uniref:hypothetical protein n=1 Tax=Parabacteroides distasonis TaxID=823 RepID=UPI003219593F